MEICQCSIFFEEGVNNIIPNAHAKSIIHTYKQSPYEGNLYLAKYEKIAYNNEITKNNSVLAKYEKIV